MNSLLIAAALTGAGCVATAPESTGNVSHSEPVAALDASPTYVVEPRPVDWTTLRETCFDPDWILPERRTDGGRDLALELTELLDAELELVHPDDPLRPLRSFGDFARAAGEVDPVRRGAWLREALAGDVALETSRRSAILQLLDDRVLLGDDWNPAKDDEADGFWLIDPWKLPADSPPWSGIEVDLIAEQGALFLRSDFATIKEVENDYSVYLQNIGSSFEEIGPLPGSHVVGRDEEDRPFSGCRIGFRSDLPFPFGGYTCELHVLNRVNAEGLFTTHIYTTSGDFYWMAGRDVFLPVKTSAGQPVGYLIVRVYGFDLKGVPDGRSNRQEALRGSLGNFKRRAEALFRQRGARWGDRPGKIPEITVRGLR